MGCTSISCIVFEWIHEINQPRISANKRESHFPCVRVLCSGWSPTQNRTLSWKMLREKPACGFFCSYIIFHTTQIESQLERKTGTPVFPIAFFQTACDSAEAISRSRARRRKKNAICENSRRFAVFLISCFHTQQYPSWIGFTPTPRKSHCNTISL